MPIVAHPASRGGLLPLKLLERMLGAGLAGFELGHRENRDPGLRRLRDLCRERDLIVTGSSDYHGLGKPNQPGENTTTAEMVARILDRATGSAPSTREGDEGASLTADAAGESRVRLRRALAPSARRTRPG